jgi:hypothetical protein
MVKAFAGYDEMKLSQTASLYTRDLAAASGLSESEVAEEALYAVKNAKENADMESKMLPFRDSWTPELETALSEYAADFMTFAETFGEYASLVRNTAVQTTEGDEPEQMTEADPPVSETGEAPVS